jgi:radical SAM protein with 4Fe4S-binding SPASM domain
MDAFGKRSAGITDSTKNGIIGCRDVTEGVAPPEDIADSYFFLNSKCILHSGKVGHVMYNFESGEIVKLRKEQGEIIHLSEQGLTVAKIATRLSLSISDLRFILDKMVTSKIGGYFRSRVYIEKFKLGNSITLSANKIMDIVINRCFIELPGQCDRGCSFCGQASSAPCLICTRSDERPDIIVLERFLERFLVMSIRNLTFYGGDPLADLDQFLSMVEFCRKQKFSGVISVITNGRLIDRELANTLSRYKIHIIMPIIPDQTSVEHGLDPHAVDFFKLARAAGISFSCAVLDFGDETSVNRIISYLKQVSPNSYQRILMLKSTETDKGYSPNNLPAQTFRTNVNSYYHLLSHHRCLYGVLTISGNGDVLPCPHMENEFMGNIRTPDVLDHIFGDDIIFRYWDMNPDKVDKCSQCALRYGCYDCRATEIRLTGDLYGKQLCALSAT